MPGQRATLSPLFTWRGAICDSITLPPTARLVALVVSLHMNERGGSAFPGAALLSAETGLSERAVRDHLKLLVQEGWLQLVERGGLRGERRRANAYQATIPPHVQPTPAGDAGVEALPLQEVPSTPAGGSSQDDIESVIPTAEAPPPRQRKRGPRDDLFDALVEAFGPASTPSRASFYGKKVSDLIAAKATPEQVAAARKEMARRGWEKPSPEAMVKHWDDLLQNSGREQAQNPAARRFWEDGK